MQLRIKAATVAAITIVTTAIVLLAMAGCSRERGENGQTAEQVEITIGVSLLTRTHPFYQDLEAGLDEIAELVMDREAREDHRVVGIGAD